MWTGFPGPNGLLDVWNIGWKKRNNRFHGKRHDSVKPIISKFQSFRPPGFGRGGMSDQILGLDIRRNRISAVLLNRGLKGCWIKAHRFEEIPADKDFVAAVDRCLKNIVDSMDLSDAVCVSAWPADKISYRNIRVPFTDRKKILQILPFELESLTPFDAGDIVMDFRVLRESDKEAELIVAYMERSVLDSLLGILASHRLNPEIVTVGGLPAALYSPDPSDEGEKVLRVDISGRWAAVFAGSPGRIDYIRAFPIRSAPDDRVRSLCKNVQRTLCAFEQISASNPAPERVVVTGFDPVDAGVEEEMERLLGIPVVHADLLRNHFSAPKRAPEPAWDPGRMDNALALAMSAVNRRNLLNFRKGPYAVQPFRAIHARRMLMMGGLALFVLLAVLLNIGLDSYSLEKKLAGLDARIHTLFKRTFPDVQRIEAPLMQARVKLRQARKTFQPGLEPEADVLAVDILEAISRRIPPGIDVELQRLVITPGSVLISGHTNAFNAVDTMKNQLEGADIFKAVSISSANLDKTGDRVRFKLKATTGPVP